MLDTPSENNIFKMSCLHIATMEIFDSHIHSEGRSIEDLTKMSKAGIKYAITCALYPISPLYPGTLIDLFRKLVEFETEKGERAGMKIYPAVGIHPRCIPPNWRKVIDFMEEDRGWIAFGEIGLETANHREIEVFEAQLKLAKKHDMPIIVHTPRKNKKAIAEKEVEIIEKISVPEEIVLIDHINSEIIDIVKKGYRAGLTVQLGKLSVNEAIKIVKKHGEEKFIANSDTGFRESDMFALVRLAERLDSDRVLLENALKFFRV